MTETTINLADPPAPEAPAPLPPPRRWLLVNPATGEVNDILYDGVSPYDAPDGWHLQAAPIP